jgi:crotonobetainyl-CoA:carnitine CoA-transferase CaiB-like acyl-CoA transferase
LTVSQFGAGPFGTQLLADLGAEIIKIEDGAAGGDVSRHVGPYIGDDDSLYFQSFNRGKKSITLDLKHPDGQAVLRDLARVSHAVYNNLRGDLPARLGLTYAALADVNPAIVCCSLSGFGATGPRAAEPAFDYLIQGYAGWMSITGEPDAPPGKCGVSVVDFAAGYASMAALMAGLWDAARSGVGRDIDMSLLDTAVSMLSYFAIWALNRDWTPTRVADSGHQALPPRISRRATAGSSSSATRRNSGPRWWRPWSCPPWAATRALRASPTVSPTRMSCCRSSRRASPSARPRSGWRVCAARCRARRSTPSPRPWKTSRCARVTW